MQKKGGRQHPDDRYSKVAPGSPESLARGMLPSSPPLVASVDHPTLAMCGESCLRNPLRGNPHGGVCEGRGRWCCQGRPKRAPSWKRPIQPRNTYSALASLLLGCNQVIVTTLRWRT